MGPVIMLITIVAGGFALVAAMLGSIVGFGGSYFIQARKARSEDRAGFERVVSEVLSAADAMRDASDRFSKFAGMTLIRDAAKNAMMFLAAPDWLLDEAVPLRKKMLRAVITAAEEHFGPKPTDDRYMQLIFPAAQRLRSALTPLRIREDPAIARAANRLSDATENWAISTASEYRKEWGQALEEFRAVALGKLSAQQVGTESPDPENEDRGEDRSADPMLPFRLTSAAIVAISLGLILVRFKESFRPGQH
jgi:hypothetical protein